MLKEDLVLLQQFGIDVGIIGTECQGDDDR